MIKKKSAIQTALYFLKFRPRSVFEVEKKLTQKKFTPAEIKKTISILQTERLLNDLEFAKMWIRNRNTLKPSGKRLIFWELKKLGLSEEIIKKAQDQDEIPEIDKARQAVQNKIKQYQKLPIQERRLKLLQFLTRRGFDYEKSKQALEILKI